MKRILFSGFLFLFLAVGSWAIEVAGVDFPETVQVGEQTLVLNGAGVRQKTIFNVNIYAQGLYLLEKTSDSDAILVADEPMMIRLAIVTGLISAKEFTDSTLAAFDESTGGNMAPLQKEIDMFLSVFQEKIKKGDVYDIVYIPGTGIEVFKNGATTSPVCIPGMAIKEATFGCWIGVRSEDRLMKLRACLLGSKK